MKDQFFGTFDSAVSNLIETVEVAYLEVGSLFIVAFIVHAMAIGNTVILVAKMSTSGHR